MPVDTEKKVEEAKNKAILEAGPESTKTYAEVLSELDEVAKLLYSPDDYTGVVQSTVDQLSEVDTIATALNPEIKQLIENAFEDTKIDYKVFFLE